jgi:Protein of unknown function (DUF2934)
MTHIGDQDGKSKTASAVDEKHYPEVRREDHERPEPSRLPAHAEISARAHQLWLEQGCPEGAQEENWLQAERELHDSMVSRRLTEISHEKGGSVQS